MNYIVTSENVHKMAREFKKEFTTIDTIEHIEEKRFKDVRELRELDELEIKDFLGLKMR